MRALDILVVDDDHDLASGIADMLEAEGHRAALAGSGGAALEVARDRAFGMIFLDIKLPGMTGYRIDDLLMEAVKTGGLAVLT